MTKKTSFDSRSVEPEFFDFNIFRVRSTTAGVRKQGYAQTNEYEGRTVLRCNREQESARAKDNTY